MKKAKINFQVFLLLFSAAAFGNKGKNPGDDGIFKSQFMFKEELI